MEKVFLIRKADKLSYFVTSNCEPEYDCVAEFFDKGLAIVCMLKLNSL